MRGMVLAAGLGTRIRSVSASLPKPLIPVHGFPLIAFALGQLKSAGITDVVVNTFHLADLIEEALASTGGLGVDVTFSREPTRLETGGGIAVARDLIGDESFVVINSDTICDVDLRKVIAGHLHHRPAATMVIREHPDPAAYSAVEWEEDTGRVVDIRGKLGVKTPSSRPTLFTGIQVMSPEVFDYVRPVRESSVDAFYLPALRDGRTIRGYFTDGYWADIGTPERYAAVAREFDPANLKHFQPLPIHAPEAP